MDLHFRDFHLEEGKGKNENIQINIFSKKNMKL